jgi:hypothetical protein
VTCHDYTPLAEIVNGFARFWVKIDVRFALPAYDRGLQNIAANGPWTS